MPPPGTRTRTLQHGYTHWAPERVPKLNLGCGTDVRPAGEGWTNMDHYPLKGVDVVHDIMAPPWPLKDASFDWVLASHVLEHVPHRIPGTSRDGIFLVLEEIWRVLKPGGHLEAIVPWYRSHEWHEEPTHTRAVHPRMWLYVEPGNTMNYYTSARFRLARTEFVQSPRPPLDKVYVGGKGVFYWACRRPVVRRVVGRRAYARYLVEKVRDDDALGLTRPR
jgi:ubiquinone/menaquinone biosynthesis C-methylase UbiE